MAIMILRLTEESSIKIFNRGKFPVIFGGDHSIYPLISEFAKSIMGRLSYTFDAHMDNLNRMMMKNM